MQDDPSNTSDHDLLKRSAAGDGQAFHTLVDRHADRLFSIATSLIGNAADAEDVLQETLAGAFRGLKKFEGRASVKTWLTRILVLQVAKWRRDRKGKQPLPIESAEPPVTHGESAATERKLDLHAALAALSADHQEVLVLREFEQLSYEEIAAVLDVPRGTVESRLFRARAELREKLKAYL
ncbi:sigma-70 family RNA polymerase sigma factor [soil metagenome]